ncbi:PRC-barrel domain-containing protein [Brucella pituitosa]|uniref:PRC-barrel domain-containing protein n=1 Tax=Brucella pituitosa TaxID=571256 RepID=UPI003F4A8B3B
MHRIILTAAVSLAMISFANAQTATMTEETQTEVFVTAKPTDVLSYNLVGLNILNGDNTNIGEIKDLIISNAQLSGYIVSVGGFLGVGEKYVVVSPEAVDITYFDDEKKWSAVMNSTKEEIQKAPEFKYEGRWAK